MSPAARLQQAAAALATHPSVSHAEVRVRLTRDGDAVPVVYVALQRRARFVPEAFLALVEPWLPPNSSPASCVRVAAIPLTAAGVVDEHALAQVPVIDEGVRGEWEGVARNLVGEAVIGVVRREGRPKAPLLHVNDLVPGVSRRVQPSAATLPGGAGRQMLTRSTRPPAIATGGALAHRPGAARTLGEALQRTARDHPDNLLRLLEPTGAVSSTSYSALLDDARRVLAGLRRAGLREREIVLLQVARLEQFLPAFWACVLGGLCPVTVAVPDSASERSGVAQKLKAAWRGTGDPALLTTSADAPVVRHLLGGDGESEPALRLLTMEEFGRDELADTFESAPDDVALLQLSSGSTGVSKCVQVTHRGAVAHALGVQQRLALTPDDVSLTWLPMDHVGALLMGHITDLYLGRPQVLVPTSSILERPLVWLDLLERYRVTHTWSPNFGYKLVADALASAPGRQWDLSAMRGFVNGGEQVTLPVLRAFLDAVRPFGVRDAAMQPAFGMAETCTGIVYESDFGFDRSVREIADTSLGTELRAPAAGERTATVVSCGAPIPGVSIRIVGSDGAGLPEAVIGRVQVQGAVVTPGYLNNPDATRDVLAEDGWLTTGDLGFLEDARLTITGREKDIVIVNGVNLPCHEIEDLVGMLPGVRSTYVGACAVPDDQTGSESLGVFFVPEPTASGEIASMVRDIRREVSTRLGLTPAVVVPVEPALFPKTTSGKIQRSELKRRFEGGSFDASVRAVDLQLGNDRTVPQWFHRRVWRARAFPRPAASAAPHVALVFSREQALADRFQLAWSDAGATVTAIRLEATLAQPGKTSRRVAGDEWATFARIVRELEESGRGPSLVVVLDDAVASAMVSAEDVDGVLRERASALRALVQGLADATRVQRPRRLVIIGRSAYSRSAADSLGPGSGFSRALLKSAAQELDWLTCRFVDIGDEHSRVDVETLRVVCESPADEPEVALRDGHSFVVRLERLQPQALAGERPPFTPGGVYLVSGGLGGVASELASALLRHFGARLLLVGRRGLEDRGEPGTERSPAARLRALERLPGEVHYAQADVCDRAAMQALAADTRARWGRIDGVLHCAGAYAERLLSDETDLTAADVWRAKVTGALVLHEIVSETPGALFVSSSSVSGQFGAYSASAYAAANAFLDGLAESQRRLGLRATSIAWSLWDGVGMGRSFAARDTLASHGYSILSKPRAVASFFAACAPEEPWVSVGLDDSHPAIRSLLLEREVGADYLALRVAGAQGLSLRAALEGRTLADRFGTPVSCAVDTEPAGRWTEQADASKATRAVSVAAGRQVPSEVEARVLGIWRDVLGCDSVGLEEAFFDLGGSSVHVARIAGALAEAFGQKVSPVDIYTYPTVTAQAAHLSRARQLQGTVTPGARRGAQRRAAVRDRAAALQTTGTV